MAGHYVATSDASLAHKRRVARGRADRETTNSKRVCTVRDSST